MESTTAVPALAHAPSITELAARCIETAGPDHGADPDRVVAAIVNMARTQVRNSFAALNRPGDAEKFAQLVSHDKFSHHMLWDHLTGDPGKIQVHNQLAELLNSELVKQIVVGAIRQRFSTPQRNLGTSLE